MLCSSCEWNHWNFNRFGSQSGPFAVFLNSVRNKGFKKLIKNILSINLSHSQCWLSEKSVVKQCAETTPAPVQICTSMWRSSEARDVQAGRRGDAVEGQGQGQRGEHQQMSSSFIRLRIWTFVIAVAVTLQTALHQMASGWGCSAPGGSRVTSKAVCPGLVNIVFVLCGGFSSRMWPLSTCSINRVAQVVSLKNWTAPKGAALVNFSSWFAFCFYTAGQPWWASCTDQTWVRWTSPNGRTNC